MLLQKLIASLVLVLLTGPAFAIALPQDADVAPAKQQVAKPEQTADEPTEPVGPALVLSGARILTLENSAAFENGTIVIVGGKIAAVGASVEIPDGARRIDCTGMTITPGLIDARSRLWLDAASASQSGGSASLDAYDGLDPFGEDWRDVVRGGVTSVYLQPGNNDVCAGVGIVVATAPSNSAETLTVLKRDAGLQAALGVGNDTSGKGRAAQYERLKKLFSDAKKYQDEWKTWNDYQAKKKAEAEKADATKPATGESETSREGRGRPEAADGDAAPPTRRGPPDGAGGERPTGGRRGFGGRRPAGETQETPPATTAEKKPAESADGKAAEKKEEEKPPTKPTEDPIKDRLVKVLNGEIPVQMTVNNPDDARRALELAKEFGLRLILDGLVNTGAGAADLQAKRLPMVLGPWMNGSGQNDDLSKFWQSELANYDGRFAIATFGGSGRSSRGLRSHAAQAVAAGCDAERALAAVTIDAATILGVSDQAGSIAVGKRADIAVFAGDPLNGCTAVQMTIVGGEIAFENDSKGRIENSSIVDAKSVSLPEKFPDYYSITSNRVIAADGSVSQRTITIENGKIVGNTDGNKSVNNVQHIDLGEAVVSPGLFAAHTNVGISAADFKAIESDARHLSAADGFDPTDRAVSEMVKSGVLMALLVPPSQNTLAGRAATIRLMAKQSIAQADLGDNFVLSASARSRERFPASLSGQRNMILALFSDTPAATRVYLPEVTRQLLVESRAAGTSGLLAGKRLAIFEATTDGEVRTALDLIEANKLNAAIVGVENVDKFIERLVATRTTLIVRPMDDSDQQWRTDDLIAAANAGVSILWTGNSGLQMRRSAAMAVAGGLDQKTAMSSLTGGKFRESGDQADLVIWSGVPTDLRSRPLAVIVDGQRVPNKANGK